MIRHRLMLERGMRHPLLGPLLVILFCILIALVYAHGLHDTHHDDGAIGMGTTICIGLVSLLGVLLLVRVGRALSATLLPVHVGRAPPYQRRPQRTLRWVIQAPPPLLRL